MAEDLIFLVLNEAMAFVTLIIVFPGFLPPEDRMEFVFVVLLFIPLSFIWWFLLALFPIAYFLLWWAGELEHYNPYFHEWPFNRRKASR